VKPEPGKAWALNENIEAARPQAKIEAVFDTVTFPSRSLGSFTNEFSDRRVELTVI
jgi:hypothetical protein